MVFGKLTSQLGFDDLERLKKEDVRESIVLEYKSENPGRHAVLKELCAFANTFGGHLIFGVEEKESQRGQIESIPGIDPIPSFEQTLRQWALEWLYPPLTDFHVSDPIPTGGNAKVCYIVHIPASSLAPHFVETRKGCYIRVSEHSMPFEPKLATLDEVLRLSDRRGAILGQRSTIIEDALSRWRSRGPWIPRRPTGQAMSPTMLFWAVPEFPVGHVVDPGRLGEVSESANVKYRKTSAYNWLAASGPGAGASASFPSEFSHVFSQQDALIFGAPGFEYQSHMEITAWGSFLVSQELAAEWNLEGQVHVGPRRHHLIMYPMLYMLFLRNLLRIIGFEARVSVRCELTSIKGVKIQDLERRWGGVEYLQAAGNSAATGFACSFADDSVWWGRTLSAADLVGRLRDYAVSAYRQLAFGVGCLDAYQNPSDEEILNWALTRLEPEKAHL
jgi:hypothetical protein